MSEDSTTLAPIDLGPPTPTRSVTIATLALALSKAQRMMKAASFDRENPFFKMRYATLASIWDSIREPLGCNELAVVQDALSTDGRYGVTTTLIHSSGEWLQSTLLLKPVKDDPQGVGSCLTYARRYSLAALIGVVAEEDDDGEAATRKAQVLPPQGPPPRTRRRPPEATSKEPEDIPDKGVDQPPEASTGDAKVRAINALYALARKAELLAQNSDGSYPPLEDSPFGKRMFRLFKHTDLAKLRDGQRQQLVYMCQGIIRDKETR